jgi:hypothetical protein
MVVVLPVAVFTADMAAAIAASTADTIQATVRLVFTHTATIDRYD